MSRNGHQLDDVLAHLLNRRLSRNQLRKLTTVNNATVDFSSNAYLSLSTQPAVQQEFLAHLHAAAAAPSPAATTSTSTTTPPSNSSKPPSLLGSGGSRLLDGNTPHAEALERTIAAFHRAPAGLLFNSAMDANVGLFGCVPQPGDAIVYDALIHASVHDGMRMSRAGLRIPFAHSRVWEHGTEGGRGVSSSSSNGYGNGKFPAAGGGTSSLEVVLESLLHGPEGALFRSGKRNVFVAVEGVYSMDGDLAPLGDIMDCVERCLPRGNGHVIVDEAHSVGILGERGRGLVCELGLEERVWARVLGFGKAMGCSGG
jgi:8-amino-7-oxononanoate synthase